MTSTSDLYLTFVDDCSDPEVTSIDAPEVNEMMTTVLKEFGETQTLTRLPDIVLTTVSAELWNRDICGPIAVSGDFNGLTFVEYADTEYDITDPGTVAQHARIIASPTENSQINRDGYTLVLEFTLTNYDAILASKSFNLVVKECHVMEFQASPTPPISLQYDIFSAVKVLDIADYYTLRPACQY